ncbi:MAG TPA: GGDEF domain-containing protein [Henriciella marina]|uniref:GGDEF domain-containing protein n=1 Tax=Henriciella sp. TaxID=1968823 RepID=UPI0017CA5711|nr:GGDEF domain-containing protein [Henriciella sp.]HIG21058.1 GGDEF domain-containing protein [Henriciella sp.]HIK66001.1 GGDEF domain-containing protein [Henriciella marina]
MRAVVFIVTLILSASFAAANAQNCDYVASVYQNADPAVDIGEVATRTSDFAAISGSNGGLFEGHSLTGVLWLRFAHEGQGACETPQWLQLKFPYLKDVTLHAASISPDGRKIMTEIAPLPLQYPVWALPLADQAAYTDYYVRIAHPDFLILPFEIASPARIIGEVAVFGVISVALIVLFLALAFQTLALGRVLDRSDTAAFVGFSISAAVYVFISSGLMGSLFGDVMLDTRHLLLTSQAVLLWTAVVFLRANIKPIATPIIDGTFRVLQFAALPTLLAPFLGGLVASLAFLFAFIVAPLIILGLLGALTFQRQGRAAGLLIGWCPTILATVWIYGRLIDITPYLPINHHLVGLGLFLTALRFNAVLAFKYRGEARAARTDMLTGLPNRRAMMECARRFDGGNLELSALALMDLRKFKVVNDTHGHAAGDHLLTEISRRISAVLPKQAHFFRIGGDEFIILIRGGLRRAEVESLLTKVSDLVSQPVSYSGTSCHVAANIGAIMGPFPDGVSFSSLMGAADKLAYMAKQPDTADILIELWTHADELTHDEMPGAMRTRPT